MCPKGHRLVDTRSPTHQVPHTLRQRTIPPWILTPIQTLPRYLLQSCHPQGEGESGVFVLVVSTTHRDPVPLWTGRSEGERRQVRWVGLYVTTSEIPYDTGGPLWGTHRGGTEE